MHLIKLIFSLLLYVFLADILWLGFIAKRLYDQSIGSLLKTSTNGMSPNWPAAFMVYVAIVAGIIFFVLPKADGNIYLGLMWGAVFGAITYGIYDFTNLAVLINWPLKISLIDIIWGMVICGSASGLAVILNR